MQRMLFLLTVALLMPLTAVAADKCAKPPYGDKYGYRVYMKSLNSVVPASHVFPPICRAKFDGDSRVRKALHSIGITDRQIQRLPVSALVIKEEMALRNQYLAAEEFQKGRVAFNRGDYRQALGEDRKAAAHGSERAETALGVMYYTGQYVAQDYAKAFKWLRLAAMQGNAFAEHRLSVMYHSGLGVPQNDTKAYKWLLIEEANVPATGRRHAILSKAGRVFAEVLTPAQVTQAQQEASAWHSVY